MGQNPSAHDKHRVQVDITGADGIVTDVERRRCALAMETWERMVRLHDRPDPSPAVGVALLARYFYIDVACPGCRQVARLDLRKMNLHPQTPLASLVMRFKCSRCRGGHGPLPRILTIGTTPPETIYERDQRRAEEAWRREKQK